MPLRRDSQGGGTNADGTRSTEYCSHCYRAGRFTEPDLTAREMTVKVQGKLRKMRFPGFLARYLAKDVPMLRRWRRALFQRTRWKKERKQLTQAHVWPRSSPQAPTRTSIATA